MVVCFYAYLPASCILPVSAQCLPDCSNAVLRIRDPVPFWPLDPGWVDSQHPDTGSGINKPDHIFYSLETIFLFFWGLKYLNSLIRLRDPGWRQFGSGMENSRIRDKHPGSATLPWCMPNCFCDTLDCINACQTAINVCLALCLYGCVRGFL